MIQHHVKERSKKDSMFAEAKTSKTMDLIALSEALFARNTELTAGIEGK